jgi:hypothetical protein
MWIGGRPSDLVPHGMILLDGVGLIVSPGVTQPPIANDCPGANIAVGYVQWGIKKIDLHAMMIY